MSIRLAHGLRSHFLLVVFSSACFAFLCDTVQAHVKLDSPNGGETLIGGSDFTIEWHVEVMHNQINWDLWYSTESSSGPWLEIVTDLATGDPATNSPHTFEWSTPNLNIPSAWVRVRQDNVGQDYFSISESSFSIATALGGADFTGDGNIDAADLAAWQLEFGAATGALPAHGDADLDEDVDGTDFLAWQNGFDGAIAVSAVQSVPEPGAMVMLLVGLSFCAWKLR